MKKFMTLLCTAAMALCCFACSDDSDDKSKDDPTKDLCVGSQTKCESSVLYSCSEEGKWVESEKCAAGCNVSADACKVDSGTTCSKEGERTCGEDNFVLTCSNGKLQKAEKACVDGCSMGGCKLDFDGKDVLNTGSPCSIKDQSYCTQGVKMVCDGSVLLPAYVKDGKVQKCSDLRSDLSCSGDNTGLGNGDGKCVITCKDGSTVDYVDENSKCPE